MKGVSMASSQIRACRHNAPIFKFPKSAKHSETSAHGATVEHTRSDYAVTTTAIIPRRLVSVLGVCISDVTKESAFRLLEGVIHDGSGRCRSVFIANAHTLNLATEQPEYRNILNSADF